MAYEDYIRKLDELPYGKLGMRRLEDMTVRQVFRRWGHERTGRRVTVHVLDEAHDDSIVYQRGNESYPNGRCEHTSVKSMLEAYGDYIAGYLVFWDHSEPPTVIYASRR